MDVTFVNAFVGSVRNVVQTMCSMDVTFGKPFLKTDNEPRSDVSGVIGFSGDATGSLVLDLSFDVATKMATAFAGVDITPEHADFADAVGELCNMIAGNAKKEFGEHMNVSISLPNVITGRNHTVLASRTTKHIVIPCRCPAGTFHVEVGMVVQPAARAAAAAAVGAGA